MINLQKDILIDISKNWLDIKDIVNFDTSLQENIRAFLSIIYKSKFYIIKRNIDFNKWIYLKNIICNNLNIYSISDEFIEYIRLNGLYIKYINFNLNSIKKLDYILSFLPNLIYLNLGSLTSKLVLNDYICISKLNLEYLNVEIENDKILELFENSFPKIKDLDIDGYGLSEECYYNVLKNTKNLEKLNLEFFDEFNFEILENIFQNNDNLNTLYLPFDSDSDADDRLQYFNIIITYGINLLNLNISYIAIDLFLLLNKCINLENICFSYCDLYITKTYKYNLNIKKIEIVNCELINYDVFEILLRNSQNLEFLNLDNTQYDYQDLFIFLKDIKDLKTLQLKSTNLTNDFIYKIELNLYDLTELNINDSIIENDQLIHLSYYLTKLEIFSFVRSSITDIIFLNSILNFKYLTDINLINNDIITDKSIILLSKNNIELEKFYISDNRKITSDSIIQLIIKFKNLKILYLRKCFNINSNILNYIDNYSHNLKLLDVMETLNNPFLINKKIKIKYKY